MRVASQDDEFAGHRREALRSYIECKHGINEVALRVSPEDTRRPERECGSPLRLSWFAFSG